MIMIKTEGKREIGRLRERKLEKERYRRKDRKVA